MTKGQNTGYSINSINNRFQYIHFTILDQKNSQHCAVQKIMSQLAVGLVGPKPVAVSSLPPNYALTKNAQTDCAADKS